VGALVTVVGADVVDTVMGAGAKGKKHIEDQLVYFITNVSLVHKATIIIQ